MKKIFYIFVKINYSLCYKCLEIKDVFKMNIKKWLNRSSGGEWFEPFINNKTLFYIFLITTIICGIIIGGILFINFFNYY